MTTLTDYQFILPERLTSVRDMPILRPRYVSTLDHSDRGYIKLNPGSNTPRNIEDITANVDPSTKKGVFNDVKYLDASSLNGYNFFLVTDVSTSFNEKVQVTQTFGDTEVVYYFGRAPIQYRISGVLFDGYETPWFQKFIALYWTILRGTQVARNQDLLEIGLPNVVLFGSITDLSYSQNASNDTVVNFSFTVLVKNMRVKPVTYHYMDAAQKARILQSNENFKKNESTLGVSKLYSPAKIDIETLKDNYMNMAAKLPSMFRSGGSSDTGSGNGSSGGPGTEVGKQPALPEYAFLTGLFSPVYGVIASIMKVTSSISTKIQDLVGKVETPIRNLINDINKFRSKVESIIKAVRGFRDQIGKIRRRLEDLKASIQTFKKTIGAIKSFPTTFRDNMKGTISTIHKGNSPNFMLNSKFTNPAIKGIILKKSPG